GVLTGRCACPSPAPRCKGIERAQKRGGGGDLRLEPLAIAFPEQFWHHPHAERERPQDHERVKHGCTSWGEYTTLTPPAPCRLGGGREDEAGHERHEQRGERRHHGGLP